MEKREAEIIAEGLKMRAPAFFGAEITHSDGEVHDGDPGPGDLHRDLDIKIHPVAANSERAHGRERVDPEADHRIADLSLLADLKIDPELGEFTRLPAEGGRRLIV